MDAGQRLQQTQPDLRDPARRQRTVRLDHLGEGPAVHQLHDDPRVAVHLHHVVDGDDPGMLEHRQRPRLAPGPLPQHGVLVGRHVLGRLQLLDGDVPSQHLVARPPDRAHAAPAQGSKQPVPVGDTTIGHLAPGDGTAGGEGHITARSAPGSQVDGTFYTLQG